MSHNRIKVGSAEPNSSGVISPALNDLSNVSGSPSDGQVLKYSSSSSSWSPSNSSSSTARICFSSWRAQSGFNTSTYYYDVNDNIIWRNAQFRIDDSTYATRTTSSGDLVPATATSWTQYWTLKTSALNGKAIRCEAAHFARSVSNNQHIRYQWGVGSSNLATFTPIGNIAEQVGGQYVQTALGHYIVGGSDINLALKVTSISSNAALMTGSHSYFSHLTISVLA